MLHLIQKSPFQSNCLSECLNIAGNDDQFLLMQDGVYAIQQSEFINSGRSIFALKDDLSARGISISDEQKNNVIAIDYDQFVELTLETDKTISWF